VEKMADGPAQVHCGAYKLEYPGQAGSFCAAFEEPWGRRLIGMLGMKRIRRWTRRIRLRLQAHGVILLYHRVAEIDADPQLLCVSPRHFQEHLEILRARCQPMSLGDLMQALADGRLPGRFAVVTFDDGYADNLHNAKRLLIGAGIPATVFVATGYLGSGREFWWDELEQLLLPAGESNAARWNVLEKSAPSARHERYRELCAQLPRMSVNDRSRTMADLMRELGSDVRTRPSHRILAAEDVGKLVEGGLVAVGAHAISHPLLSALSADEQRREVGGSKARLEEILGRPVRSFSYPFGYRGSYTAESVRIVREAGFGCACANFTGVVARGADQFELPRFLVRDWNGDEFARRLNAFFDGAKGQG
jgi:peptidoglycan/xylan/chitin deacetylase (PgdA/CDA1 family)